MNPPRNFGPLLKAFVVSLTLLLIAATIVLIPSLKLIPIYWPKSIVEHIYPDGEVRLAPSGSPRNDDGIVRSRPLEAVRILREDGTSELGYLLSGGDSPRLQSSTRFPDYWQPDLDCHLQWESASGEIGEISCDQVRSVTWPNRMTVQEKAALAVDLLWSRSGLVVQSRLPDVRDAGEQHQQPIEPERDPGAVGQAASQGLK